MNERTKNIIAWIVVIILVWAMVLVWRYNSEKEAARRCPDKDISNPSEYCQLYWEYHKNKKSACEKLAEEVEETLEKYPVTTRRYRLELLINEVKEVENEQQ